jgi:hypothetical protein
VPHWRKGRDLREISGRRSRGLVVRLFDLPFELHHCLSVSPHDAESRVPHLVRMEAQEFAGSHSFRTSKRRLPPFVTPAVRSPRRRDGVDSDKRTIRGSALVSASRRAAKICPTSAPARRGSVFTLLQDFHRWGG